MKQKSRPYWLSGGMIGIFTCIVLLITYLVIPSSPPSIILATLTGHILLPFLFNAFHSSSTFTQNSYGVLYMIFLSGVYFGIGALIGSKIQKRKKTQRYRG